MTFAVGVFIPPWSEDFEQPNKPVWILDIDEPFRSLLLFVFVILGFGI